MMLRSALAGVLLLIASDALACRCAQQTLGEYFAAADVVAIARLQAAQESQSPSGGDQQLIFELLASPHKGAVDGGQLVALTASSSASCGVAADLGAVYVVFARRSDLEPDTLRVDTCSGTRVHLSTALAEPVGFVDVPARFVASQLNALFGMSVLADVAATMPREDDPTNSGFIGLLDLKALAHGGSTRMFADRTTTSPQIADLHDYDELVTRELGYEVAAAVVYAQIGDWYRLQTASGEFGWVQAAEAGTYFPYAELPIRRLAYLTEAWSGLVWPEPGAGLPQRMTALNADMPREQPAEILESTRLGGSLWFRVHVLSQDPCRGGDVKTRLAGWVPAYGRSGSPTVGYYSRGC